MAIVVPKRRATEIVGRFGFLEVEQHECEAEGLDPYTCYTLRLDDWVSVAAVTEDGRFLLVRQHRHGLDDVTIEPAGGIIDPGEEPATSALRELAEETGYEAGSIEPLGWVHPNPALQANRCYMFLARGARLSGGNEGEPVRSSGRGDDTESTEAVLMTADEVLAAIRDGRISHALGVLALERALAAVQ